MSGNEGDDAFLFVVHLFAGEDFVSAETVTGVQGETKVVEVLIELAVLVGEIEDGKDVFVVAEVLEEYGSMTSSPHSL